MLESLLEGPGFLLGTDTNGNLEDHPRIRKSLVTMGVSELTLGLGLGYIVVNGLVCPLT